MMRRSGLFLCLGALTLLGSIAVSCGGGSSGTGGGTKGPYKVAGIWQASFSPAFGSTSASYGAITQSGTAAMFDSSGNIVLFPPVSGASTFSGTLTTYAVNGSFFAGGAVQLTDPAQGNVNSATSITGSFSGSSSDTFALSALNGSSTPVSGTLNGRFSGFATTALLTFASDGTFTGGEFSGPGSNCNIQGALTPGGASNVFDLTYNVVSGSCSADTETGIAFASSTDYFNVNGGTDPYYLYMIILHSTSPQVRPYVITLYQ